MKRILFPLLALALLPVAADADTLYQRVQAQVAAQTAVKHPNINFFGLKQAFRFPKYRNFLFEQVDTIMGKNKTTLSFAALLKQPYFKREFAELSEAQREKLAEIAAKADDPAVVSEPELLAMLVLLDANLEMNPAQQKEHFKMDTYPSLGEKGGLVNAYPNEIDALVKLAKNHTRAIEKQREAEEAAREAQQERERVAARAQREAEAMQALQDVQVFDANGNLNDSEAAKAMGLLTTFALQGQETALQQAAKSVFGEQLKSIRGTGTRSNDLAAELKDGTKLDTQWNLLVTVTVTYPDRTHKRFGEDGTPIDE